MKKASQVARRVRRARGAAQVERQRNGGSAKKPGREAPRRTGRPGTVLTIRDPARLAEEIQSVIRTVHGNSLNAAARAIGISEPTLRRYARKKARRIKLDTLAHLARLFPPGRGALRQSVFGDATMDAVLAYVFWLQSLTKNIITPRPLVVPPLAYGARTWDGAELELEKLVVRTKAVAPDVIADFIALVYTRQHAEDRHRLAMLRTFEPLLAYPVTGGVERHPDELSDDDFAAFVRAGLAREKILLQRDADIARAQDAVRRPLPTVSPLTIGDRLKRDTPNTPRSMVR